MLDKTKKWLLWQEKCWIKQTKVVAMATKNDRRQQCKTLRTTWSTLVCIMALLIYVYDM